MPYAQPDSTVVAMKLLEIDDWAQDAPATTKTPLEQLAWWLGLGSNTLTAAYMECETTGPIAPEQLQKLAKLALQHAAVVLAALQDYLAEDIGAFVSPSRDRLSTLVDQFAADGASASYREDELGMHQDQVLVAQFVPAITSGSPNLALGDPDASRLVELAYRSIGAAAYFLAAYEQRPAYTDPYA